MAESTERISEILSNYQKDLSAVDLNWPQKVQRAVNYINKHLFDPHLTVRSMKDRCHINGKNFSGVFKYYVGKPPRQYWLEHRITVAKQLLTEEMLGKTSILEIALAVGFRSHAAFTMAFKKYNEYPPSELRDGKN